MLRFATWLSQTSISLTIQIHLWIIPLIQCIHMIAFCVASISVFMIAARVIGIGGKYQSLRETLERFIPSMSLSLCVALVTGLLLVLGEPIRDLMSFSFWAKMSLLALVTLATIFFQAATTRNIGYWEEVAINLWSIKTAAMFIALIWLAIIVLGRLIAYDNIWGALSHVPRD